MPITIRQGDVALVATKTLPADCTQVAAINGSIILAYGEAMGHAHKIDDWGAAKAMTDTAVVLAAHRARLLVDQVGNRYLEVVEPVTLTHEEHTAHIIPPGLYEIPDQFEHTSEKALRHVLD